MTPGADSSLCLPLAKELCSTFSLCAKLIFHVATSMRLAALLPPQPYGPVGTAAAWSAVPKRRSRSRTALAAEVLFLRKQLAYYRDHQIRPRCLTDAARLSLVLWSRLFDWKEALMVVTPGTFVRRHRRGFKLYWRWKARGGQPALPKDIRQLIARMVRENITWGEERVADELSLELGSLGKKRYLPYLWHI